MFNWKLIEFVTKAMQLEIYYVKNKCMKQMFFLDFEYNEIRSRALDFI